MTDKTARCLVLACGNPLRSDDGVGLRLASWAAQRFQADSGVRVLSSQQWTPDLAHEIASADSVLFVDCSIEAAPGHVNLDPVPMASEESGSTTHHMSPPALLALAHSLYASRPAHAMLLTVGAGSMELGETLTGPVQAAMPRAQRVLEKAVLRFLGQ
ncbi:MAG: hydrogenase maturation protease [Terracidiphilus sp.]|jgi:hydrogenase maturation protease